MKKLSYLALAAVLGASGFAAAPAFAASSSVGSVPMCDTGNKQDFQGAEQQLLNSRKFIGRTVESVDDWANCIKVIYQNNHGGTTTAFYDPDTLNLIKVMRTNS